MFSRLSGAISIVFLLAGSLLAQETGIGRALQSIPGIDSVRRLDPPPGYPEAYELEILQPLDHANPGGKSFHQRVYLSHLDPARPMVLVTEGYAAWRNALSEPTRLLHANQVIVEHRYFGRSQPDSLNWQYLTVEQSAGDLHAVVSRLKDLYPGKWVSTGVSKGGQTTCLYRYYFPDDVDVSIPYVAPINLAQEDPRPTEFLRHVGADSVRERIRAFQILALKREKEMLPALDSLARERKYTFSLGEALVYEFAVLEYPVAFWQYGGIGRLAAMPRDTASPKEIFSHLNSVVSFSLYSDAGVSFFQPFQYQAYTEMGYYTYDITELKPYLKVLRNPSNIVLAPKGVPLEYHCEVFQAINRWLRYEGKNFIYIYGQNDPWSASAVELTGMTNSIRMISPGGNHGSKIRDLSKEQQHLVYQNLEEWLGVKIEPIGERRTK
jgi:hypothetical protein